MKFFSQLPSHYSHLPSPLVLETKYSQYSGFLLLIVFTVLLSLIWPLEASFQWLVQAGLLWGLAIYRTFKLLILNRSSMQLDIYPNLGWANRLTLFRGFLIAITGGFIFQDNLSEKVLLIPALSYLIAAIIDRVDGYIARRAQHESLLGTKLDTEFDALGLIIAPMLAVWIGQIHWSYLAVSLAYYLFQWGLHWRSNKNKPVYPLPTNMSRRAVAGFQMGFLAVVLWPILAPPATMVAGGAFMLPLLGGFLIDWLIVSGRLKLDLPEVKNFFKLFDRLLQNFLLPALRVLIVYLLILCLLRTNSFFIPNNELTLSSTFLVLSLLLSSAMILLGVNGRLFAIILSCLLCWFYLSHNMLKLDVILLCLVIWVMQFGTGKYSLWLWDDHWVNRYDGA